MTEIPFTQYLRPKGERREVFIERPDEVCQKAQEILNRGFRFEIEELITGQVSMTVSDEEDDYALEICRNGSEVPEAVDRLINRFYQELSEPNSL